MRSNKENIVVYIEDKRQYIMTVDPIGKKLNFIQRFLKRINLLYKSHQEPTISVGVLEWQDEKRERVVFKQIKNHEQQSKNNN